MIDEDLYRRHRDAVCQSDFGRALLEEGFSPQQVQEIILMDAVGLVHPDADREEFMREVLENALIPDSEELRRYALEFAAGWSFDRKRLMPRQDRNGIPRLDTETMAHISRHGGTGRGDPLRDRHRETVCESEFGQALLEIGLMPEQVQNAALIHALERKRWGNTEAADSADLLHSKEFLRMLLREGTTPQTVAEREAALAMASSHSFDYDRALEHICRTKIEEESQKAREPIAWDSYNELIDKHRETVCLSGFGQVLLHAGFTPQHVQDTILIHAFGKEYQRFGADVDDHRSGSMIVILEDAQVPEKPADRQAALTTAAGHSFDLDRATVMPDPDGVPTLDEATQRQVCWAGVSLADRAREKHAGYAETTERSWRTQTRNSHATSDAATPGSNRR